MKTTRFELLLEQYITGQLTQAGQEEFFLLLNEESNIALLQQILKEEWEQGTFDATANEQVAGLVEKYVLQKINEKPERKIFRLGRAWRIAAAAAAIIICAGAGYWFITRSSSPEKPVVQAAPAKVEAPGINRATITLANGKKVYLDSLGNGVVAIEQGAHVIKLADGAVSYQAVGDNNSAAAPVYNTLFNPRGSKVISLMLSDGTKVWLNNESSLIYPARFTGNARNVTITGEAYFEVAHRASMPFVVKTEKGEIEVLGTHFNINAYNDEADMKVTLLEGRVRVSAGAGNVVITPGQQALVATDKLQMVPGVDTSKVMAWKNGYFQFQGSDIKEVMRQIARWYDTEIGYEGKIPERQFAGQLQRTASLSDVLRILEESNVHFRVNGRKITIVP